MTSLATGASPMHERRSVMSQEERQPSDVDMQKLVGFIPLAGSSRQSAPAVSGGSPARSTHTSLVGRPAGAGGTRSSLPGLTGVTAGSPEATRSRSPTAQPPGAGRTPKGATAAPKPREP